MDQMQFYNTRFSKQRPVDIIHLSNARFLWDVVPGEFQDDIESISEVGGGYGGNLHHLANMAKVPVTNLELSDKAREIGQQHYPDVKHVFFDAVKFAPAEESCIVMCDVIEHLPDDIDLVDKARGSSKYLLVKIPLEKCWLNTLLRKMGRYPKIGESHPSGHLHEYAHGDAHALLENRGWEIISHKVHIPFDDMPALLAEREAAGTPGLSTTLKLKKAFKWLPRGWYVTLFGGDFFAFAE